MKRKIVASLIAVVIFAVGYVLGLRTGKINTRQQIRNNVLQCQKQGVISNAECRDAVISAITE